MLGWLSLASVRASLRKRLRASSLISSAAEITLMATSRSRRLSRARYTTPIPPAPSGDRISYGPSLVPEVRAIRTALYSERTVSQWMRRFWTYCRKLPANCAFAALGVARSKQPTSAAASNFIRDLLRNAAGALNRRAQLRVFLPAHTRDRVDHSLRLAELDVVRCRRTRRSHTRHRRSRGLCQSFSDCP